MMCWADCWVWKANPWLDDDTVRRNLSGLIVGAVETTSKLVTLALQELLRRPAVLQAARAAALEGDIEKPSRPRPVGSAARGP